MTPYNISDSVFRHKIQTIRGTAGVTAFPAFRRALLHKLSTQSCSGCLGAAFDNTAKPAESEVPHMPQYQAEVLELLRNDSAPLTWGISHEGEARAYRMPFEAVEAPDTPRASTEAHRPTGTRSSGNFANVSGVSAESNAASEQPANSADGAAPTGAPPGDDAAAAQAADSAARVDSAGDQTAAAASENLASATAYMAREAAPSDEAMRRWREAQATDREHVYRTMQPLETDWLGEATAVAGMLALFSWVYIGPALTFTALVAAIAYHSRLAGLFLTTMVLLAFVPLKPDFGDWGRQTYTWQAWRRYFRLRWVRPAGAYLQPGRHYLFLHFPHSVFPLGSFLSMALTGEKGGMGIPERTGGTVASVLLHLPVLRYILVKMGCVQVGRQSLVQLLQQRSAGMIPEGIAGVFRGASRQKEQIYWSRRLGVCRIALHTGVSVVPVYCLGQSQVFSYAGFENLSRRLRATVGVFWGRYGLPLPYKTDLILALGRPIPVRKTPNPSQVEIQALHDRITHEVQALYEQHKRLHPAMDGKELIVT